LEAHTGEYAGAGDN